MLSLPSLVSGRKAMTGAVAVLAALAVAGPANAATAVESTGSSADSGGATRSFNFTMYSSGASSVGSGSQDTSFTLIERKAG